MWWACGIAGGEREPCAPGEEFAGLGGDGEPDPVLVDVVEGQVAHADVLRPLHLLTGRRPQPAAAVRRDPATTCGCTTVSRRWTCAAYSPSGWPATAESRCSPPPVPGPSRRLDHQGANIPPHPLTAMGGVNSLSPRKRGVDRRIDGLLERPHPSRGPSKPIFRAVPALPAGRGGPSLSDLAVESPSRQRSRASRRSATTSGSCGPAFSRWTCPSAGPGPGRRLPRRQSRGRRTAAVLRRCSAHQTAYGTTRIVPLTWGGAEGNRSPDLLDANWGQRGCLRHHARSEGTVRVRTAVGGSVGCCTWQLYAVRPARLITCLAVAARPHPGLETCPWCVRTRRDYSALWMDGLAGLAGRRFRRQTCAMPKRRRADQWEGVEDNCKLGSPLSWRP